MTLNDGEVVYDHLEAGRRCVLIRKFDFASGAYPTATGEI
jgi:hypothetical protein